eukprot:m.79413 g.79413  ORF g.79413 m.79413 type:complete len:389 (-) comp25212_c0_seq1:150-1316(-)
MYMSNMPLHNVFATALLACTTTAASVPSSGSLYSFDTQWSPKLPMGGHTYSGVAIAGESVFVTQRGNVSLQPVIVLNKTNGDMIRGFGKTDIGIAGNVTAGTWGAHGIVTDVCGYACVPDASLDDAFVRVWVEDFTNYTVTAFSQTGRKLMQIGTPGVNGTGLNPLQFDHVADAAIVPGMMNPVPPPPPPSPHPPPMPPAHGNALLYATDGDGGVNNRVVKVEIKEDAEPPYMVHWATPSMYDSPHSITLHARTNLLIVADRGHNAIRLIDAGTGKDLGIWDCGLHFGEQGVPFGVRTLTYKGDDLLVVASMDNPQDHMYQRITLLDASKLSSATGSKSECSAVQVITIDPAKYSGPHLLGVDTSNGDIYAALVSDTPLSTVLRYTRN